MRQETEKVKIRDYKKIKAYQLADDLVLKIYSVTNRFPKEEIYGFTSQIRRACVSVAANIVEGASRQHKKDYLNFLFIAKGSISEAEYLVSVARRLGYIPQDLFDDVNKTIDEASRTLAGLINSVSKEVVQGSVSRVSSLVSQV